MPHNTETAVSKPFTTGKLPTASACTAFGAIYRRCSRYFALRDARQIITYLVADFDH